MKKKSILFISISLLLFFSLSMIAYLFFIPKSCFSSDLRKTIDYEIDDRIKRRYHEDYNNVFLMFYSINDTEYLSMYFTNRYEAEIFRGMSIYRNKNVIYQGIDESIAKEFINFDALSMTEPNINPKYIGFNDSDPKVDYYKISNKRFIKFKPSEEHLNSIVNILTDLNYLQIPPPIPKE